VSGSFVFFFFFFVLFSFCFFFYFCFEHFDVVTDVVVILTSVHPAVVYAFGATKGPSRARVLWTPRALWWCAHPTLEATSSSLVVVVVWAPGATIRGFEPGAVCWWTTSDPSQARTTHAAFGSLSGSRALARRAA